jgi:hypothetical protein
MVAPTEFRLFKGGRFVKRPYEHSSLILHRPRFGVPPRALTAKPSKFGCANRFAIFFAQGDTGNVVSLKNNKIFDFNLLSIKK